MNGNFNGANGYNKYQYNGKEWNDDFSLGWNDYGARFYDPAMARWVAVDPLSEKYLRWSPYIYTKDNPVRFIDPDGMQVSDWYKDGEGKIRFDKNVKDQKTAEAKGGKYLGETHSEGGGDFRKDGTAFFSDKVKGMKYMHANSYKNGKQYNEQAGYFVKGGVIVGNDEKSNVSQSTEALTGLISKKNGNIPTQAKSGGKEYDIIAPVHVHQNDGMGVLPPSTPDIQSLESLSPTKVGFVIGDKTIMPYSKSQTLSLDKKEFYNHVSEYGDYTINFWIKNIKK